MNTARCSQRFKRSPRRPRNTKRLPPKTTCRIVSASTARPLKPLRVSDTPAASQTFAEAGTGVVSHALRRAATLLRPPHLGTGSMHPPSISKRSQPVAHAEDLMPSSPAIIAQANLRNRHSRYPGLRNHLDLLPTVSETAHPLARHL